MTEEGQEQSPGKCPRCGKPAQWLPVDAQRRGRVCPACGWVELPESRVHRHTVFTLLHKLFPNSPLVRMLDGILLLFYARRKEP